MIGGQTKHNHQCEQAGEEKAAAAVEKYLSLTDKQRVKGVIDVVDDLITGTGVNVSYSDEFVPMA